MILEDPRERWWGEGGGAATCRSFDQLKIRCGSVSSTPEFAPAHPPDPPTLP